MKRWFLILLALIIIFPAAVTAGFSAGVAVAVCDRPECTGGPPPPPRGGCTRSDREKSRRLRLLLPVASIIAGRYHCSAVRSRKLLSGPKDFYHIC